MKSKVLATALTVTVLASAVANAPGILRARGTAQSAEPTSVVANTSEFPADHYASGYHFGSVTLPDELDPGAWLDTLLQDAEAQIAGWRHTWTDRDPAPESSVLNPYRRPAHWEAEGTLLAFASPPSGASGGFGPGVRTRFAGGMIGAGGSGSGPVAKDQGGKGPQDVPGPEPTDERGNDSGPVDQSGNGPVDGSNTSGPNDQSGGGPVDESDTGPVDERRDEPAPGPVDEPGSGPVDEQGDQPLNEPGDGPSMDDDVPDVAEPPPVSPDDLISLPSGPTNQDPPSDQDNPNPTPVDEPVHVPEPASMSLLALGVAGLLMFGRRRALVRVRHRGSRRDS